MDIRELLYSLNNNYNVILNKLNKYIAEQASLLQNACYKPYNIIPDILKSLGMNYNDVKTTITDMIKKEDWYLIRDVDTWVLLFLTHMAIHNKHNDDHSVIFINALSLKYYASLQRKYIKFCNQDAFEQAFGLLSKRHLFIKHGDISGALLYISNEVYNTHKQHINLEISNMIAIDNIAKFVYGLRHRINQSIKSFAGAYYKAVNIITNKNDEDEVDINSIDNSMILITKVINKVINNMFIYKIHTHDDIYRDINYETKISYKALKVLIPVIFNNDDSKEITKKIINIVLNNNTYELLTDETKWMEYIKSSIATRTKHDIRNLLTQLILTNKYVIDVYNRNSIDFKRKFIVAIGLYIGYYIVRIGYDL